MNLMLTAAFSHVKHYCTVNSNGPIEKERVSVILYELLHTKLENLYNTAFIYRIYSAHWNMNNVKQDTGTGPRPYATAITGEFDGHVTNLVTVQHVTNSFWNVLN